MGSALKKEKGERGGDGPLAFFIIGAGRSHTAKAAHPAEWRRCPAGIEAPLHAKPFERNQDAYCLNGKAMAYE